MNVLTTAMKRKELLVRILFVIASVILALLVVESALDKGISTRDRFIFFGLAFASIAFYFWIRRSAKKRSTDPIIMLAFIESFGVMATVVSLMAPRPAIESSPGRIEKLGAESLKGIQGVGDDTRVIRQAQDHLISRIGINNQSQIRANIEGLWGESDCQVTYRLKLTENALEIRSAESDPDIRPFRGRYTILSERDELSGGNLKQSVFNTSEVVGISPGYSVQFRYESDGLNEALIWDHRLRSTTPLRLSRCRS